MAGTPNQKSKIAIQKFLAPLELGNLLCDRTRTALSPDEIAAKLNCSKDLVLKLIESGQLGAINVGTGKYKFYRVPAAEWEKFLRNRAAA